ncbi:MAG: dynamin family protein [Pseudomonadota bacterium]
MPEAVQDTVLTERLESLEAHLSRENPVLVDAVKSFRELDRVGHGMCLLSPSESYAAQVPWWPLVSILGTFSSGKSSFINWFTGASLQSTGNQAVDDKFTVICYSRDETPRTLPGLALDADLRFPFFQISNEIERVASGEGRRIDSYLQLKTSNSEAVRGKILIDSPGFDADQQRTSTLKLTDQIIDLSDLVLVFFDARHPEPGAMQDTLKHLVSDTISRPDSNKFLYVLNQLDTTAREDNPEDVVAAWQRALASAGLTAGKFYTIYNLDAALPIEDEALRKRFEKKRATDMAAIEERIKQVEVERSYRIVGALEKQAHYIGEQDVPAIRSLLAQWRRWVLIGDAVFIAVLMALTVGLAVWADFDFGGWSLGLLGGSVAAWAPVVALLVALGVFHFWLRGFVHGQMQRRMQRADDLRYSYALTRNTRWWRSVFWKRPSGWNAGARKQITAVLEQSTRFVQNLNDSFTNPSGTDA